MRRLKTQIAMAGILVLSASLANAGAAVIGVAISGNFRLDGASIDGNATVLEGNRIETDKDSARLELVNGNRVRLGAGAIGALYSNRLTLERGATELVTSTPFSIDAMNFRVTVDGPSAAARLVLQSQKALHVDAIAGNVKVSTRSGVLLARLVPGSSLEFTPPADGATSPATIVGVVRKVGDRFFLQDETSKVDLELKGLDVASYVGQRVEVQGIMADASTVPGASVSIKVVKVTKLDKPAIAHSGAHLPKAVIAGVGVAAAAAGAGVIMSNKTETKSVSPSSR